MSRGFAGNTLTQNWPQACGTARLRWSTWTSGWIRSKDEAIESSESERVLSQVNLKVKCLTNYGTTRLGWSTWTSGWMANRDKKCS